MKEAVMADGFLVALTASVLAAAVTSAGIYTIRRFGAWGRRNTIYFVSLGQEYLAHQSKSLFYRDATF
jgi:hypothetical protein